MTIKLLGNELGNVIKEQAGSKYFKIVENIRFNSKKYRSTKEEKYLNNIAQQSHRNVKQKSMQALGYKSFAGCECHNTRCEFTH